ncbi:MAG: hypothetical protein HY738_04370 [Bacteroidia bacterium]|nr:hypothetical protein [Bacteroidia bacterium]
MDTKLTLRLNKRVIDRAKYYARGHRTSLSRMIEFYLDSITKSEKQEFEITPLVESLSGVVTLKLDYDYKNEHANYLNKKYK